MKHRLCLLVPHLVSLWLRVSAQTSVETVFLSKCQLNNSESISIRLCLCGSASTTFVAKPSWSFDQRNNPTVSRLQRIQNNTARLVMIKRKRDHVTPLLKELHWLPVKFRCQYEIETLTYRHFEGSLPPYLSSPLCTYEPSRSLRSSKEKLLKIPKRNVKSFGERSFSFTAPSVWNSLPADLRNLPTLSQFKSNFKTSSCSPRLSRRSSAPDYRLCICICFVCF